MQRTVEEQKGPKMLSIISVKKISMITLLIAAALLGVSLVLVIQSPPVTHSGNADEVLQDSNNTTEIFDEQELRAQADLVLQYLQDQDFEQLATVAPSAPTNGVKFQPHSLILKGGISGSYRYWGPTFSASQLEEMKPTDTCEWFPYEWNNDHQISLDMNMGDFLNKYFCTRDYRNAPYVGVDKVFVFNGTSEPFNNDWPFPENHCVTYHFPGTDTLGDTLELVFEKPRDRWMLVAVAHKKTCHKDELLDQANTVLQYLKDRDFEQLATVIHKDKGVMFSPHTFLHESNLTFTSSQINALKLSDIYEWGSYAGSGEPIDLRVYDYFKVFVCDRDFINAPRIDVDKLLQTGNTISNIDEFFPDAHFVEYNFPGDGPYWDSLRLVFEQSGGQWMLVAVVHDHWTI